MIDLGSIKAAVARDGWFHGPVGPLDRDRLLALAGEFATPFRSSESTDHTISTYVRTPVDPGERISLEFHNECVYLAEDPSYVLFYCADMAEVAGGGTGLITSEVILEQLTEAERRTAEDFNAVLHLGGGRKRDYHLLRPHPTTGAPCIYYAARFPRAICRLPVPRSLQVPSPAHLALLDRVDEVSLTHHRFVNWSAGTLLVLDNARTMHARYVVTSGKLVLWRALCR
jgi:alpha-ketoglutarate-dependent taurine dioxygenase